MLWLIFWGRTMPDIDFIRTDIEYRRRQVQRLRSEIRELQHSGISSVSAEVLLDRMRNKIDELCAERDRLKKENSQVTTREKYWDIDGEPASAMVRPNWTSCGVGLDRLCARQVAAA